jgi:spore coat protein CotH
MSIRVCAFVLVCVSAGTASAQTIDDFFNPAVLHRIDLLVNTRDWAALKAAFDQNTYYPADVTWNGVTVRNVGIRSRGLGSRSGTKPALRVDANRYALGQEFLGRKSFLLDNLVQDPSGIRERAAMLLHQRLGVPAPREAHAMLYVNGEYAGLYGVIESVDKPFLGRVFGEQNGDTENDGYLFEYDYVDPWFWTYLGSDLSLYGGRFDPVTHENDTDFDKFSPIEALLRAINDSAAANFADAVDPYLDLTAFMRHVAIQNFIAEDDGILGGAGTANFHFYRFEGTTRHRFIAWDEDKAFSSTDRSIFTHHDSFPLMSRAMAVPALRAVYLDTLLEAATSALEPGDGGPGWLAGEFAAQRDLVADAAHTDPLKPYSNAEFDQAIEWLLTFPAARAASVRCQVAQARGQACAP